MLYHRLRNGSSFSCIVRTGQDLSSGLCTRVCFGGGIVRKLRFLECRSLMGLHVLK